MWLLLIFDDFYCLWGTLTIERNLCWFLLVCVSVYMCVNEHLSVLAFAVSDRTPSVWQAQFVSHFWYHSALSGLPETLKCTHRKVNTHTNLHTLQPSSWPLQSVSCSNATASVDHHHDSLSSSSLRTHARDTPLKISLQLQRVDLSHLRTECS